ncbi:MAG: hypothetical protein VW397_04050, partial [Candidatus Margulisiibacteriota bacterium]
MEIQYNKQQPVQKQSLGSDKKLTSLEEQRFQSKLTKLDLMNLTAKMRNDISVKPKDYNLRNAKKTKMRTVYDTDTVEKPMAKRSDIGMAEVMKAFIKMDKRGYEGESMAARPVTRLLHRFLKSKFRFRDRMSLNPSKRDKKKFKQLLYEKYKTSLSENNPNNPKSETEYFFSNFKAELHRFTDKSKPTIEGCKLTREGSMALRIFIDNVYEEYNNPNNEKPEHEKKNELIAFFETMTSDPVSDDIRERTLSSLLMTETFTDDVKLEILLKLSCAEKILNNEIKVRLREAGAEGNFINFVDGHDEYVNATATRKVRELVLKALKSENENIKDFGKLAISSMEKIGSKEETNKERFVTSNRSDLPL